MSIHKKGCGSHTTEFFSTMKMNGKVKFIFICILEEFASPVYSERGQTQKNSFFHRGMQRKIFGFMEGMPSGESKGRIAM